MLLHICLVPCHFLYEFVLQEDLNALFLIVKTLFLIFSLEVIIVFLFLGFFYFLLFELFLNKLSCSLLVLFHRIFFLCLCGRKSLTRDDVYATIPEINNRLARYFVHSFFVTLCKAFAIVDHRCKFDRFFIIWII